MYTAMLGDGVEGAQGCRCDGTIRSRRRDRQRGVPEPCAQAHGHSRMYIMYIVNSIQLSENI